MSTLDYRVQIARLMSSHAPFRKGQEGSKSALGDQPPDPAITMLSLALMQQTRPARDDNDLLQGAQPLDETQRSGSDGIRSTQQLSSTVDPIRTTIVTGVGYPNQTPESCVSSGIETHETEDGSAPVQASLPPQLNQCSREHPGGNTQFHTSFTSYSFLDSDFVSRLSTTDTEYLERLGCFELPVPEVLDQLLAAYFRYVQPHFPLIDESSFWDLYTSSSTSTGTASRMSLPVLYALVLVSSSVSQAQAR